MKSDLIVPRRFAAALADAHRKLSSLRIVRGREVSLKGLRGWIFEHTVRTCLEDEMRKRGISAAMQEQASIAGRASVDLVVGPVAIEIKVAGLMEDLSDRYSGYRKAVEAKGWHYCYLTLQEGYPPYVRAARRAFGRRRAFFLDQSGEWRRFLWEILPLIKAEKSRPSRAPTPQ